MLEGDMLRMVYLTLAVAVTIGISGATAQTNDQPVSKLQSLTGVVKAVSAWSLTLERAGQEVKFDVDRTTRVFAKGREAAFNDLVYRPGGRRLTEFVKVGDQVTVGYRPGSVIAVEMRLVQK
jgi:hypothetical protein